MKRGVSGIGEDDSYTGKGLLRLEENARKNIDSFQKRTKPTVNIFILKPKINGIVAVITYNVWTLRSSWPILSVHHPHGRPNTRWVNGAHEVLTCTCQNAFAAYSPGGRGWEGGAAPGWILLPECWCRCRQLIRIMCVVWAAPKSMQNMWGARYGTVCRSCSAESRVRNTEDLVPVAVMELQQLDFRCVTSTSNGWLNSLIKQIYGSALSAALNGGSKGANRTQSIISIAVCTFLMMMTSTAH